MAVFRGIQRMRLKYILFIFCSVGLLVFMYFNQGSKKDPNFNQQSPASIINPSKLYEGKVQSKVSKEPRVNNGLFGNTNTKGLLAEETEESPWYKQEPDKVKVVVVEEHHEVLKYWFEAVEAGIIPKTGNTLLHIDGHSDGAPPMYLDGYPLYRPPVNKEELTIMLQRNDAFIVEAIMTGVIDRVIWVWPSWDTARHTDKLSRYFCEYGLSTVKNPGKNETEEFCICYSANPSMNTTSNSNSRQSQQRECYFLDVDANNMVKLANGKCKINKNIHVTWDEVMDAEFVSSLDTDEVFQPGEHVLIDIDEDFFGCERAVDGILNKRVDWNDLDTINEYLASMICLKHAKQEQMANTFMYKNIQVLLEICNSKCDTDLLSTKANAILEEYIAKDSTMFCSGHNTVMTVSQRASIILAKIMSILMRFSAIQLKELMKLGFCSSTTLKGFIHQVGGAGFTICHGFNVPNMTVVSLHSPTHAQIQTMITYLEIAMGHSNLPKAELVTVCRSIRDGYTPRKHFKSIESGIINSLNAIKNQHYSLFYDSHLLGGKQGWFN